MCEEIQCNDYLELLYDSTKGVQRLTPAVSETVRPLVIFSRGFANDCLTISKRVLRDS